MTNSKTTKRALVSSVLAVFLCVAMLIGTTFAWFTDTASTGINKIQAGNLDVALEMKTATGWVNAEGKTLNFINKDGNTDILWEPGAKFTLPAVKIVNNGNLALKYKVVVTAIAGDDKLAEVLDVFYTDTARNINNKKVGTLKEILASTDTDGFAHGNLEAGQATGEITLSLQMMTKAGNAYQGLSIEGLAITVLATQDTVESDSFNNLYDENAEYNTADVNTTAKLITSGELTIHEDLSIDSTKTGGNSDVIRVTGGNHTITGGSYVASGTKSNSALRVDGGTVTIEGGSFEVKEDNNCIYAAGGNIIIKGGEFKSEKEYDNHYWVLNIKDNSGSVITVMGGKFYKFDPSNARTGDGEIVIADGYHVENKGDWYYVLPDGVQLSDSGVKLTSDITLSEKLNFNYDNVTLDLNDKTVTVAKNCGVVVYGDNVTIKNGTIKRPDGSDYSYGLLISGANTVIDGVTIDSGINVSGYANDTDNTLKSDVSAEIKNCDITVDNSWGYYVVCVQGNATATVSDSTVTKDNNGKANFYFWVEKEYVEDGATVGSSTLILKNVTKNSNCNAVDYNPGGVAPTIQ